MIDCLKCGAANPPSTTRCQNCRAFLPITVSFDKDRRSSAGRGFASAPPQQNASRRHGGFDVFDDDDDDAEVIDYAQSGGSTLVHDLKSHSPKGGGRKGGKQKIKDERDFPFSFHDEEEDVFTSAEVHGGGNNKRTEYRQGRLVEVLDEDDPDKDLIRTDYREVEDDFLQDDLPLMPESRSERRAERRREEPRPPRSSARASAPPSRGGAASRSSSSLSSSSSSSSSSLGPVTYVPGKGIVPLSESKVAPKPPPLPRSGAMPASARPLSGSQAPVSPSSGAQRPLASYGQGKTSDSTVVDGRPALVDPPRPARERPRERPAADLSPAPSSFSGAPRRGLPSAYDDISPAPSRQKRSPMPSTEKLPAVGGGSSSISGSSTPSYNLDDATDRDHLPSLRYRARLEQLGPGGTIVRTTGLYRGRTIVGRGDADLDMGDDPTVTRWHALLNLRDEGVFLTDMDSLNGVFSKLTDEIPLADKQSFLVGDQHFIYRNTWDEPEDPNHVAIGARGYDEAARLLLQREGGQVCGIYFLTDRFVIGRTQGDVVFGDDEEMAHEHAALRRSGSKHLLRDLQSEGGTYIRLRSDREHRLHDGDCIQIGRSRFRLLVTRKSVL